MWNKSDCKQLENIGISEEQVEKQIQTLKKGVQFAKILRPAVIGDGLLQMDSNIIKLNAKLYDDACKSKKLMKFVPASGAASRMFKALFEFRKSDNKEDFLKDKNSNSPYNFFNNISKFAFYNDLKNSINPLSTYSIDNHNLNNEILDYLLTEEGLNYGNKPKGLLKFHKYKNHERTPLHEHLIEGTLYANSNGIVNIHFTVSPEHLKDFKTHISDIQSIIEKEYNVKFNIDFSIQKPYTDTIAVDMDNEPFRGIDNSLLFRPGGHGALIENLNDIDADLIFIKNIDNVVPDSLKQKTVEYKKALAGLLLSYQKIIFNYIRQLENKNKVLANEITEIEDFIHNKLCVNFKDAYNFNNKEDKINFLKSKLNRPLRVCGMVRNEGEPGGGPFWVLNEDKSISLQIVEASQINKDDDKQFEILQKSTHFNPVDLVCSTKDYKGNKFDLKKYIDWSTCFISNKSKNGKALKALELPGLWNGAMADWNTIFVEVDLITFNPVKTVNDLLRPEHQD